MKFDYTKTKQTARHVNVVEIINPHPDGQAWAKCCRGHVGSVDCAFIKNQRGGARLDNKEGRLPATRYDNGNTPGQIKDAPFMCVHRTDDGYYRVCAGWDACFGNKSLAAKARA